MCNTIPGTPEGQPRKDGNTPSNGTPGNNSWFTERKEMGSELLPTPHPFVFVQSGKAEPGKKVGDLVMILPQVHLRKPCYDFTFL